MEKTSKWTTIRVLKTLKKRIEDKVKTLAQNPEIQMSDPDGKYVNHSVSSYASYILNKELNKK